MVKGSVVKIFCGGRKQDQPTGNEAVPSLFLDDCKGLDGGEGSKNEGIVLTVEGGAGGHRGVGKIDVSGQARVEEGMKDLLLLLVCQKDQNIGQEHGVVGEMYFFTLSQHSFRDKCDVVGDIRGCFGIRVRIGIRGTPEEIHVVE